MEENSKLQCSKTQNRFYKILQFLQFMYFSILIATLPLYADNENIQNTHRLNGIPEDDRKIHIANNDFYVLPYFYVQAGFGVSNTGGIAEQNNTITSFYIPTFMINVGFWQQYYINGFNFGYKIKLGYEIGVKTFGENTMVFRSSSRFVQIHLGYKYILPYASFGCEQLSIGNEFRTSANKLILYSNKGFAFGFGSSILLSRHNAVEIEIRLSKIYQYEPRILFMYDFRF